MEKDKKVRGRPREHDRDQIAEELIEWARKPDSINFNKFCCTREPPIPPTKIMLWSKESDDFRIAYETAKAFLGARREEWLSSEMLHVKAYDFNATVYDQFSKDEKRQQQEFESSLRKHEEQRPQQIIVKVQHDSLASGVNISATPLPNSTDQGSQ